MTPGGGHGAGTDRPPERGRDQLHSRRIRVSRRGARLRQRRSTPRPRYSGSIPASARCMPAGSSAGARSRPQPRPAALISGRSLAGPEVPVTVRFSNGSGNPEHPDWAPDPRGLAVKFYLPDGSRTDIVAVSSPLFPTRTPEGFLELMRAQAAGPAAAWQLPAVPRAITPRRSGCYRGGPVAAAPAGYDGSPTTDCTPFAGWMQPAARDLSAMSSGRPRGSRGSPRGRPGAGRVTTCRPGSSSGWRPQRCCSRFGSRSPRPVTRWMTRAPPGRAAAEGDGRGNAVGDRPGYRA